MLKFDSLLKSMLLALAIGLLLSWVIASSVPTSIRGTVLMRFGAVYAIASLLVCWQWNRRRRRQHQFTLDFNTWIDRWIDGDSSTSFLPSVNQDDTNRFARRMNALRASVLDRLSALGAERQRSDSVLANMVEGVLAIDHQRRVLVANVAARDFLSIESHEVVGRKLLEVVRLPEVAEIVDRTFDQHDRHQVAITSSANRHLLIHSIWLPSQTHGGVLLTIHDQTQIKQLEALRREFVANVSHELKTPLAAIKGYAETLQLGAIDDKENAAHFVDQIIAQANRLEHLIADMMRLARAQSHSQQQELVDVPLGPIVAQCADTYLPLAAQKDIHLDVQAIPAHVIVRGRREDLVTVANNLVGNALRYTDSGGHVWIQCNDENDFWVLVVGDNGHGIPHEDQDRIFERFYRVEKARDQQYGGTGLGLAIVKNLVQSFGGRMRLKSKPGEGSVFEAVLPKAGTSDA